MPSDQPNEAKEDCLQCKVLGTVTFSFLSVYSFYNRSKIPKSDRSGRLFMGAFGVGAAAVAVWRAFF